MCSFTVTINKLNYTTKSFAFSVIVPHYWGEHRSPYSLVQRKTNMDTCTFLPFIMIGRSSGISMNNMKVAPLLQMYRNYL